MDPATSTTQSRAAHLRSLTQPGQPVLMVNIWDPSSAKIAATTPSTKALTTASYAIATVHGELDNEMSYETNMSAIRRIAAAVREANPSMPLAADLQDGYADVAKTVRDAIDAGVVGGNLEDVDNSTGKLRSLEENVERIRMAARAARERGVPDFVINARCDVFCFEGGSIEDAVERGKAYLAAGATTVYVWGGPKGRGVSKEEVKKLVEGLGGMVNVKMNLRPDFLNAKELAGLGVARISVGPELYLRAMDGFRMALGMMANGETFN